MGMFLFYGTPEHSTQGNTVRITALWPFFFVILESLGDNSGDNSDSGKGVPSR